MPSVKHHSTSSRIFEQIDYAQALHETQNEVEGLEDLHTYMTYGKHRLIEQGTCEWISWSVYVTLSFWLWVSSEGQVPP